MCTSCALKGQPVPLRPSMRYSWLHKRFTCLTCHRCKRVGSKGQQQQRRDKGARPMTSSTSIVCIDMIGKVRVCMCVPACVPCWYLY